MAHIQINCILYLDRLCMFLPYLEILKPLGEGLTQKFEHFIIIKNQNIILFYYCFKEPNTMYPMIFKELKNS